MSENYLGVDTKSKEFQEMEESFNLVDALLGGTSKMRAAGELYLPKLKIEDGKNGCSYSDRLNSSTLLPAYRETIEDMAGRVFGKPISLENVAKTILEYKDDFNGRGDGLIRFSEKVFYSALAYGRTFVVTDYTGNGSSESKRDQKENGDRPVAFRVEAPSVLEARYDSVGGKNKLTQFRYRQVIEEEVNEFEVKRVEEIVVYTIGKVRFSRKEKGSWSVTTTDLIADGKELDYIPVVELRFARMPPLLDVAHLNVKHWQAQSTQDHIVNTARVPILAAVGANLTEKAKKEKGAASNFYVGGVVDLPKDADLKYVSLSGESINVGTEHIKEIERQMEFAGAKVLTRTMIAFAETQAGEEAKTRVSELLFYAMMMDGFLINLLDVFGKWLGEGDAGSFIISENIDDKINKDAPLTEMSALVMQEQLSRETYFDILKLRGVVPDDVTWEDEKGRIMAERAVLYDDFSVNSVD